MAYVSNGVVITDLVMAIEAYADACVREAKMPRYAESRKIDATRERKSAHLKYMLAIDEITASHVHNLKLPLDLAALVARLEK